MECGRLEKPRAHSDTPGHRPLWLSTHHRYHSSRQVSPNEHIRCWGVSQFTCCSWLPVWSDWWSKVVYCLFVFLEKLVCSVLFSHRLNHSNKVKHWLIVKHNNFQINNGAHSLMMVRAQELCESWSCQLPVPNTSNSPYGLCGHKATLNLNFWWWEISDEANCSHLYAESDSNCHTWHQSAQYHIVLRLKVLWAERWGLHLRGEWRKMAAHAWI